MVRRIVVVGGGVAGTTAALDCARAGAEVTLLESRGRLGGAAYSFARDGIRVDNGQHVFLRCCSAYRDLLGRLDANHLVSVQPRLDITVLRPGHTRARLRRSRLPAPLHLAGSLARYPLLAPRDRLRLVGALHALGQLDCDDERLDARSFGEWLSARRQGPDAIAAIWELIGRPTLNLRPDAASLAQAAQVFQVGLLRESSAADVGYARVPLSEIHDVAARRALAGAGVDVRLRHGVSAVVARAGRFDVEISGLPTRHADAVILAVAPARCVQLLPSASRARVRELTRLGTSPIVNLHVVYDRPVLDVPLAAAVHSPVQWLFDRTAGSGVRRGQYLAVSLSAADEELWMTVAQLRARFLPALGELLGTDAKVDEFFVTREHAATFRAVPGARAHRPGPRTAVPGLVLAGSWTDTGWPATLESAVRSGHAAAHEALTRPLALQRKDAIVRPRADENGHPAPAATAAATEEVA
jgi:squalene-associated FAD-dependent desaturase